MATAAAVAVPEIEREQKSLESEIRELRDKVSAEQQNLAWLKGNQAKLVEAIALKKEKPSKAVELAAEIAGSESVISGLNSSSTPNLNAVAGKKTKPKKVQNLHLLVTEDWRRPAYAGVSSTGETFAKRGRPQDSGVRRKPLAPDEDFEFSLGQMVKEKSSGRKGKIIKLDYGFALVAHDGGEFHVPCDYLEAVA